MALCSRLRIKRTSVDRQQRHSALDNNGVKGVRDRSRGGPEQARTDDGLLKDHGGLVLASSALDFPDATIEVYDWNGVGHQA